MKLDFTTTSLNRPEILEQTYESFSRNLLNIDLKEQDLYINIDPVPNSTNANKIVQIAEKYFENVYCNFPEEPNFAKAVKWCWSNAKSDYIFHLEDDWILEKEINTNSLMSEISEETLQISLHKLIGDPRFLLAPSIIKNTFYNYWANNLTFEKDPEWQIRHRENPFDSLSSLKLTDYGSVVKDNGRQWRKQNKLAKLRSGNFVKYFDGN